jgi:hypothetical protein
MITGAVNGVAFAEVLQMVSMARCSGILHIRSGDNVASVAVCDGNVLYASSNREGRLGDFLVQCGALGAERLDAVLSLQRRKLVKQPLGTICTELGLVARDQLEPAIQSQVMRVCRDILDWDSGTFEFEPIDDLGRKTGLQGGVSIQSLLLQIAVPAGS